MCSAYPGTPSTEIFENLPQSQGQPVREWAPNEKVATEVAIGAALGGVRSLTAMKHVGVNVAADPPFLPLPTTGWTVALSLSPLTTPLCTHPKRAGQPALRPGCPAAYGGALGLSGVRGLHEGCL